MRAPTSSPRHLMAFHRAAVVAALGTLGPASAQGQGMRVTPAVLQGYRFRSIGPAVTGGRIHDIEVVPGNPAIVYVASASGGLWKTVNAGTTWTPVFDDQPVSTFGDIALAPSNPQVVWAGTGEQNNRQSTSWGNGMYRSTDGGQSWTHLGLDATRHIGRVVVDPANPDIAYVAALGNLWKPTPERGVYKTTDGGSTWRKVLYVDSLTGAVDIVMDPSDANTLYAATYQRLRRAWGFNGGGPGSGIHKTTDGGTTWRRLTNGLPAGPIGRIGLAIAATNGRVVMATVEHPGAGGTYRSTDGGETWTKMSALNPRPMYYSQIRIDPRDAQRVYVLDTDSYVSEDAGRTFHRLPTAPTYDVGVHADHHALWIDPANTRHLLLGGDGGLYETWDRGTTYRKINNFTIAQVYDVGVDMRDPYYVYGGLQDNHSWMGPVATRHWIGIINEDWKQVGFGDGMYQQPDPTSPRYVYSNSSDGGFTRVDAQTGDIVDIRPYPAPGEPPFRWDWVAPTQVSRHDPKTVYAGGNRLFISHDHGVSWEHTEDLSRRIDRDTLRLMGVLGSDPMISRNDGTASFGEITTIAESPLDASILWVGTDDGNIQVTQDGGRTWSEVSRNVQGVPHGTYVSRVVASTAGPGVVYAAFDAHRDGDFAPYAFRTDDFGRTWSMRTSGLPQDGSVNALAEYEPNPNLIFAGTEHGLFVSGDAGTHWIRFDAGLPTTLYDDLVIHPREHDLIVATHGRGLWVLDDLGALGEWSAAVAASSVHLFPVRPATIFQYWKDTSYRGQAAYAGENPPFGALIDFYVGAEVTAATITIANAGGLAVRRFELPIARGSIQRLVWDLRHEPPPLEPSGDRESAAAALPEPPHPITAQGPFVSPGTYTVTLEAGGARDTQRVTVTGDPQMPLTDAQWREREAFLLELLDLQHRAWDAASQVTREGAAAATRGSRLTRLRRNIYGLAAELNGSGAQPGSLYPPTATQRARARQLAAELQEITGTPAKPSPR